MEPACLCWNQRTTRVANGVLLSYFNVPNIRSDPVCPTQVCYHDNGPSFLSYSQFKVWNSVSVVCIVNTFLFTTNIYMYVKSLLFVVHQIGLVLPLVVICTLIRSTWFSLIEPWGSWTIISYLLLYKLVILITFQPRYYLRHRREWRLVCLRSYHWLFRA